MKIVIQAEDDLDKSTQISLTDEDLDNFNYVDLEVIKEGGVFESLTVSVEDLFRAVEVFNKIRLDNKADSSDE